MLVLRNSYYFKGFSGQFRYSLPPPHMEFSPKLMSKRSQGNLGPHTRPVSFGMLWLQIARHPSKSGLKISFFMISWEKDGLGDVSGASQCQSSVSTSHLFSPPVPQDYKMAAAAPCVINLHLKSKAERDFPYWIPYHWREKSFLEIPSRYLLVSHETKLGHMQGSLGKQESRMFSFFVGRWRLWR